MTENVFYVYQYVCPLGIPFYIGKGKGNRVNEKHLFTNVPVVEQRLYIQKNMTEIDALALENKLIRLHGRKLDGGILDNIKINQWVGSAGWFHSEETKQKISKSTLGKLKSEETKQKMRKPKSAEHVQKIREANIGRPYCPIRAAKTSATLKARNQAKREANNE